MNVAPFFQSHPVLSNLLLSLGWVVLVLLGRMAALRGVKRWDSMAYEARLRWMVQVRSVSLLILIVGLMVIWAQELRAVAFSFVALAVAFVIATKELILCLLGGILRGSDRPYTVGDRIEVQHFRGDVIDQSLFTTTILEIGPGQSIHQYTGRAVVIPNSIFLNSPIINETFTDEFVLHVFSLPMSLQDDWRQAEEALLRAAREECAPFLEEARTYMQRLAQSRGLDVPSVDPRISLHFPEPGRVNLLVRIPAPARRKGRIEQAILRRFLGLYTGRFRATH